MNKIFSLVLGLFVFCFSNICFAGDLIPVSYYYGNGCHFCEQVKPIIETLEEKYKDKISVDHYEIFENKDNYALFRSKMHLYGFSDEDMGTPTIIVGDKVLIGADEVAKGMENAINSYLDSNGNVILAQDGNVQGLIGSVDVSDTRKIHPEKKEEISLGTLRAIVSLALVDSINPCAMMVLIILLSSLMIYQKHSKGKMFATVLAFISAVYITYFVIGFGIVKVIAIAGISKIIIQAVGGIALLVGILNLKDAFFYKKGDWAIEIPDKWKGALTKLVLGVTSPVGAFTAGCTVTMFELPCTGGPYMFGLSLISSATDYYVQIILLAFYNFIFVSPLILIALLAIRGTVTIENAEEFRSKHIKSIHFIIGLVMIMAGLWVLFLR